MRNFFKLLLHIPGLYWILFWFLLWIYCGLSLLGRFDTRLKPIIFSNLDVDSLPHIIRYTITPILIFTSLTVILFLRIISGNMDYGYGSPKLLTKVVSITVLFFVLCYIAELQKNRCKAGKIGKLYYITAIIGIILPPVVLVPIVLW